MSNSLGFRSNCDHNAHRQGEATIGNQIMLPVIGDINDDAPTRRCCESMGVMVPKGFLAVIFYMGVFATVPTLYHYVDYDYTSDTTRGVVMAVSALVPLTVVTANSYMVWFNMVFAFHTAMEVYALDSIYKYASADDRSAESMALAWVAFVVIIVHLVPFLLIDRASLLILLSYAGVVVNASALVIIDPSQLLSVGFSSVTLLGATICIAARCNVPTSLLTTLRTSMQDRMCVQCAPYDA